MDIKRAYRFRFYPTPEQEVILARTFGCVRYVYNHMLRVRSDAWLKEHKRVGYHETSVALTALKKAPEYAWLNEVSSVPLQQALMHLHKGFLNFFAKRARYPAFKLKHDRQVATYVASAFRWDGETLRIAKMDDPLNIRWSRTLPKAARITTVTLSRDTSGRYFASLLCDDTARTLRKASGRIGIDCGLTHFAVFSNGEKVAAPGTFRENEAKLAKWQRRLEKKTTCSNRRAKVKRKVARLHAHITDARWDFLHKLSTRLIRENQVIAVETLSVRNMRQSRRPSKSISDASWSQFIRQLEYKARWYGRTLIGVDRRYPSSKRCSTCGHTQGAMPLSVREWTCPECGTAHDRDVNAAINILAAGLAVSAHGEAVSPVLL